MVVRDTREEYRTSIMKACWDLMQGFNKPEHYEFLIQALEEQKSKGERRETALRVVRRAHKAFMSRWEHALKLKLELLEPVDFEKVKETILTSVSHYGKVRRKNREG